MKSEKSEKYKWVCGTIVVCTLIFAIGIAWPFDLDIDLSMDENTRAAVDSAIEMMICDLECEGFKFHGNCDSLDEVKEYCEMAGVENKFDLNNTCGIMQLCDSKGNCEVSCQ